MYKITKLVLLDIIKNKIVLGYMLLLATMVWGVFGLEDNTTKGLLTLVSILLLAVPLVSIIFATIYIYNSSEFIELLISQPIRRTQIWISLFTGLCIALIVAFLFGAGIPILLYAPLHIALIIISTCSLITAIFISLAFLSASFMRDKSKGIGFTLLLWLYFALLFDGLVLFILFQLSEYPIEKIMILIMTLSPIDLARVLILLQLDASAMLGYTGAIFKDFFGEFWGIIFSFLLLIFWVFVPFFISLKKFNRKDL